MAGYFLFFRCWPGFTKPFPFEQFNALPDDELGSALDSFAREQLRLPEIRERVRQAITRGKRRHTEWVEKVKEQSKQRTGGPASATPALSPRKNFRQERWEWIRCADRTDPLVCRLGAYLGWWKREVVGQALGWPAVWFCFAFPGVGGVFGQGTASAARPGLQNPCGWVPHESAVWFHFGRWAVACATGINLALHQGDSDDREPPCKVGNSRY